MDKKDAQLEEITKVLAQNPEGLSRGEIANKLSFELNNKTLQRRLSDLVGALQVRKKGVRRATKYHTIDTGLGTLIETISPKIKDKTDRAHEIFSTESQNVLKFLEIPPHARKRVSYNRSFLENYTPNKTAYVPAGLRAQLAQGGRRVNTKLAAGTYAKQISQRLLIDLAYNSSRLEGNTYSRLDTQNLIEQGISASDKVQEETVMIMNHKEAISFLVENAEEIEFDIFTVFNLHNMLSQDLLKNPASCGNIRSIEVNIRPFKQPAFVARAVRVSAA